MITAMARRIPVFHKDTLKRRVETRANRNPISEVRANGDPFSVALNDLTIFEFNGDPTNHDQVGIRLTRRLVLAGTENRCVCCDGPLKFRAKLKRHQIFLNIVELDAVPTEFDGKTLELRPVLGTHQLHDECYEKSGQPFGNEFEEIIPFPRDFLIEFRPDQPY